MQATISKEVSGFFYYQKGKLMLTKNFKFYSPDGEGGSPTDVDTDKDKKFDYEYVKQLREEAKSNRLKAEAEAKAKSEFESKLKAIEDEKLKANGEFSKLADQHRQEAEALKKQVEELSPYKDKLTAYEKDRKEKLLASIEDETERENWKDADLNTLEKFHATYTKLKGTKAGTDNGKSGLIIKDGKKWDDYTTKELDEMFKSHPETYTKLKKEKFK